MRPNLPTALLCREVVTTQLWCRRLFLTKNFFTDLTHNDVVAAFAGESHAIKATELVR